MGVEVENFQNFMLNYCVNFMLVTLLCSEYNILSIIQCFLVDNWDNSLIQTSKQKKSEIARKT